MVNMFISFFLLIVCYVLVELLVGLLLALRFSWRLKCTYIQAYDMVIVKFDLSPKSANGLNAVNDHF